MKEKERAREREKVKEKEREREEQQKLLGEKQWPIPTLKGNGAMMKTLPRDAGARNCPTGRRESLRLRQKL